MKRLLVFLTVFTSLSAQAKFIKCPKGSNYKKVDRGFNPGAKFAYGCDKESKSGDYIYHGPYVETEINKKTKKELVTLRGKYKDGKKIGRWEFRGFRNGETWSYKLGFENYENGMKKGKSEYVKYSQTYGYEEVTFHRESYIHKKGFSEGVKNGMVEIFYGDSDKGTLKSKVKYVSGDKTGEYLGYFKNGTVAVKGNYKNGKKSGVWTEYYENGRKKNQGRYKISKAPSGFMHGMQHGEWRMWDEHGKMKKSNWKKGQIQGYWK